MAVLDYFMARRFVKDGKAGEIVLFNMLGFLSLILDFRLFAKIVDTAKLNFIQGFVSQL